MASLWCLRPGRFAASSLQVQGALFSAAGVASTSSPSLPPKGRALLSVHGSIHMRGRRCKKAGGRCLSLSTVVYSHGWGGLVRCFELFCWWMLMFGTLALALVGAFVEGGVVRHFGLPDVRPMLAVSPSGERLRSFLERGVRVGVGWIRVVSAPPAQARMVVVLCSWAGVRLMWLSDVRLSLVEPFVERCWRPALGSSRVWLVLRLSIRVVLTPGHLCCPVVRDWWVPGSVGCWVVGSAAVAWFLAGWSVGGRGQVGLGIWDVWPAGADVCGLAVGWLLRVCCCRWRLGEKYLGCAARGGCGAIRRPPPPPRLQRRRTPAKGSGGWEWTGLIWQHSVLAACSLRSLSLVGGARLAVVGLRRFGGRSVALSLASAAGADLASSVVIHCPKANYIGGVRRGTGFIPCRLLCTAGPAAVSSDLIGR